MDIPEAFGWPIWLYFWLGGVAGGAVAAASIANLAWPGRYRSLGSLSVLLALPLIVVSLLVLIYDLGRSERFINLLLEWRPTSAMWWGTWVLGASVGAYGLLLLRYRSAAERPGHLPWERLLLWANLVLAGLLVVYTGVLLAQTSRSLWNSTGLVPALFAVSALSTGTAALALAGWRRGAAVAQAVERLRQADVALLLLEAAVLVVFVGWLALLAGPAAARAAQVLLSGAFAAPFWGGVVVVGLLAPLALGAARGRVGALAEWGAAVLVLAGGLALRYVVVAGGQVGPLA